MIHAGFTNQHDNHCSPGSFHRWAALVAGAMLPRSACTICATLARLSSIDLKTISDQLGHSSIVLTADT